MSRIESGPSGQGAASSKGAGPSSRGQALAWSLGLAFPFLFYVFTCCRTIGPTDSAELIQLMVQCTLGSHVSTHNLTILTGHLFALVPFGDLAFRCNLVSAVVGGAAVALYFVLVRKLAGDGWLALILSSLLMVSHSMWWHGTIVESYAWNALLTVLMLWLLLRYERAGIDGHLYAMFGIAGLAFFNHVSMGILAVAAFVALLVSVVRRPANRARRIALASLSFAIGFLPYGVLLARDALGASSGDSALRMAVGGDFTSMMFRASQPPIRSLIEWIVLQFPSPFVLFVPVGAVVALVNEKTRWPAVAALSAAAVNVGFFMFFVTWDQFAFYLPTFVILAWLGAVGVTAAASRLRSRVAYGLLCLMLALSVLLPPWLYARLPALSATRRLSIGWRFDNAETSNLFDWAGFVANPNKRRYDDIARYSDLVFAKLPGDALLVDDDGRTFGPLRYYQKNDMRRPDVRIEVMNSWGLDEWGLAPERFVETARTYPGRVFVVSDMDPYARPLARLRGEGYRVERFDLAGERFLFEVVPPLPRAPGPLAVGEMRTGRRLDQADGVYTDEFERTDDIMVQIFLQPGSGPAPFHTEWSSPDGAVAAANEAGVIPAGAASVGARLNLGASRRRPGLWKVAAMSGGRPVATASFTIR